MKHTEGKWEVTGGVEIRSQSGLLLATMHTHLESNQVPQKANANLIASAPEMLEELIEVAYGLSHIDTEWARERLGFVHKVITKAEKGTE
jgi:hypothetical protein